MGETVEKKDIESQPLIFLMILVLKVEEGVASVLRPSLPQLRIISLTSEMSFNYYEVNVS